MKHKYKKAFSLIELSIVILIISILITGSIGISKTATDSAKSKVTKERMNIVYAAISNFVAKNKRLPCPASSIVTKGSTTYGTEGFSGSACTGSFISTNASNLTWGMVPTKTLGLDQDMAEDGFGTKFSYVVDNRFAVASVNTASTTGFEIIKSAPAQSDADSVDLLGINPQAPSGTNLLDNQNAILLLLSHGANKYNGYNANGTSINGASGLSDENNNSCNENGSCSTSSTASFNRDFVVNSTDPNFDDVVLFKTKAQLVKDAGLEFIMCNGNEAGTTTAFTDCTSTPTNNLSWVTTSLKNGYYGDKVYSNGGSCFRNCGRYGVWGTAVATTNGSVGFHAYRSSDMLNVTGDGTPVIVVFNTENYDYSNSYDASTGFFTAPVSGRYVFYTGVALQGLTASHTSGNLSFQLTSSTPVYLANFANLRSSSNTLTLLESTIMNLTAGQQVFLQLSVSNGTKVVDISLGLNQRTFFSGYLLQ